MRKLDWRIFALIVAIFVALVYPLSSGPVFVLVIRGYFDEKIYETIYAPIFWLMGGTDDDNLFGIYILWWLQVTETPFGC